MRVSSGTAALVYNWRVLAAATLSACIKLLRLSQQQANGQYYTYIMCIDIRTSARIAPWCLH